MIDFKELGIEPKILQAIEDLGFSYAMPVQEQVVPLLLQNERDIIALAQTGTGKTAAFGIPVIQRINEADRSPQVLILCPTRELCVQISSDLQDLAKYKREISIIPVYGGANIETQIRGIKKGVHIVVATPGRLIDLIHRKALQISSVHQVILDEADEMLNMGFSEDIDEILSFIPGPHSTMLFSATMPPAIASIAKNYMHDPKEIVIGHRNASAENIRHQYYIVQAKEKYLALKRIIDYSPDMYAIIFCQTRLETQEVADLLIKDGYNADSLHGDLSQAQRDYVMQRFRLKGLRLLVATDVAARGLDVDDLTHVIHYQLTKDIEAYTHRSGRTGRAGKTGISVAILNLKERHLVRNIEKSLGITFEEMPIPKGIDICKKQLFNLIDKIEKEVPGEATIEELMPLVIKKLEWIDKEEIIRRFVSMAFDRLFHYYADANDIFSPLDKENGGVKIIEAQDGYARLYINIGKIDGIRANNIIDIINEYIPGKKIPIGKIEVTKNCSFFEVAKDLAQPVIKALNKAYLENRKIEVNIADGVVNPQRSSSKRYGGGSYSGGKRYHDHSRDRKRSDKGYTDSNHSEGSKKSNRNYGKR